MSEMTLGMVRRTCGRGTGKRRVIEYFLSPLLQYGNESLRER
jgi:hypothetical protein